MESLSTQISRTLHSPIDSRWNPPGIHGFHMFHMDSTLNFFAGSPAKLLLVSTWIPDGFRVDSRLSTWSPWSPPHSTSFDLPFTGCSQLIFKAEFKNAICYSDASFYSNFYYIICFRAYIWLTSKLWEFSRKGKIWSIFLEPCAFLIEKFAKYSFRCDG